jgi:ribosome biogenesis protein BMS1
LEPEEKKKYSLIQQVNTLRREKVAIRQEKQKLRTAMNLKRKAQEEKVLEQYNKDERKKRYRDQGKEQKRREMSSR